MTAQDWATGRKAAGLTQVHAAQALGISQPYLSQLEKGLRVGSPGLEAAAAAFYRLPPTVLPLPEQPDPEPLEADRLQNELAALGYPAFAHVRAKSKTNPTALLFVALTQRNLEARLVEALPWVVFTFADLDWPWLRDHAKLRNLQNRLGFIVHLGKQVAKCRPGKSEQEYRLTAWEAELEVARLAREDTLCRDSMPEPERVWLKAHRPPVARHWNLLTNLTVEQLPYAPK